MRYLGWDETLFGISAGFFRGDSVEMEDIAVFLRVLHCFVLAGLPYKNCSVLAEKPHKNSSVPVAIPHKSYSAPAKIPHKLYAIF